jgi:ammonium transporter, Amt family
MYSGAPSILAWGSRSQIVLAVKHILGIDDSLDIFAQHGVGGMLGLLANALFAADYIISLDNVNTTVKGAKQSGHTCP